MSVKLLLAVLLVLPFCVVCEEYSATVSNHGGISAFKSRNPTHVAVIIAQWCPDCVNNKARIDSIRDAARKNGWSLLSADVGDRTQYRDANNYLRVDPLYRISYVPSIYLVRDGKIVRSISHYHLA